MTSQKARRGFTLIELVVTILLSGLCSLVATQLFIEAYRQYYSYSNRDAKFFAEYRDELHFRRLLREQPWICREDSSFVFIGDNKDSLMSIVPYQSVSCEKNQKTGRILICIKHESCVPGK